MPDKDENLCNLTLVNIYIYFIKDYVAFLVVEKSHCFSSVFFQMLESGQEQQDRKKSSTSVFSLPKYILFIFGSSGGVKFQLG